MTSVGKDSLKTQRTLAVGNRNYEYFSLPVAEQKLGDISRLPISLKILLENILRLEDGRAYTVEHAQAIAGWPKSALPPRRWHSDPRASSCRTSLACRRLSTSRRCAMALCASVVSPRRSTRSCRWIW